MWVLVATIVKGRRSHELVLLLVLVLVLDGESHLTK
jgi:hypothetical protein